MLATFMAEVLVLELSRKLHRTYHTKLQHFIAASAKVRFLKLVKIGQHFHVKCYNFTVLFLI